MTQTLSTSDETALAEAASALKQGGLVAFPTDTVYGIGAKYDDRRAVRRLYAVKARPLEKAIPILVGALSDMEGLTASFPAAAQALTEAFWPGALTLVLPRSAKVPAVVAPGVTVAVRMPAHQWLLALLQTVGPLAVSSANRSGQAPALSAEAARAALGNRIDLIIDSSLASGAKPSTIADCSVHPPAVLREGPVTVAQLRAALRETG